MDRMSDVEKYAPTLQFEIRDKYDFPSSLNMGEFFVDPNPTLYCHLKWDREWVFAYYCVYHYKDNHHRHDFTGVMSAYHNGVYHCSVTRDHFRLRLHTAGLPVFTVRAGSHSIVSFDTQFRVSQYTPAWRYDTRLLAEKQNWLEGAVGPWATPPWLWDDTKLKSRIVRQYVRERHNLATTRGLIWDNPGLLIGLLQKFGG